METTFNEGLTSALTKARKRRLSPTSAVLMRAAKRRGYPIEGMTGQHLRIGEGARQHQIYASMTGLTSISATKLAADKRQTHRRLQKLQLPVPDQIRVESLTEARQALLDLGDAVVVKPQRGSRGGGVTAGVECAEDMETAFNKAAEIAQRAAKGGSGIIVERFLPGTDHRLLVVGGQFLAALIRVPPSITGDGVRTARELINELNTDPYRDGFRLFHVDIDDTALALLRSRGYELDDVVGKNEDVPLRTASNVSSGGIPIDVTDRVHPDNRRMAEMAAEGIGLDVAGVDFISNDISRSYRDIGGGIVEVNARPGLCMHTWPRRGKPRQVADRVLDLICPKGDGGVVPKLLVAGERGIGAIAGATGHLLGCAGFAVGEASRDRRAPNDQPLETIKSNRRQVLRQLLNDPKLDALVSTTSMDRLLQRGLMLTSVDAVAILPPADESRHWVHAKGIEILERSNKGRVVFWSDDLLAQAALRSTPLDKTVLVAREPGDYTTKKWLDDGGSVVMSAWGDGDVTLTLHDRGQALFSARIAGVEQSARPIDLSDIEARMFAVALVFAAGFDASLIEKALKA
jgi:cyanophycin synthetase